MDYRVQETLATVSSTFTPDLIQFRYREMPFYQGSFAWTLKTKVDKKKTNETQITCICTFVAFTAAAEFYKSPQQCMLRWTEDDMWHECMRFGSVLHQQYVRAVIFPNKSVMNALGLDAFHSSPSE